MFATHHDPFRRRGHPGRGGVRIHGDCESSRRKILEWLDSLGLKPFITKDNAQGVASFVLADTFRKDWTPNGNTTNLYSTLAFDTTHNPLDLDRKILVRMLTGPQSFKFPSAEEWKATLRIRCNIVHAACPTQPAFHPT